MALQEQVKHELEQQLGVKIHTLEVPPDTSLGDFALPCFQFVKELKKTPQEIAKELAEKIRPGLLERTEIKGPYLNIFLSRKEKARLIAHNLQETFTPIQKKTILVEYPGPNTNKPLHVGHARNMALGSSVVKLLQKAGNTVKAVNINNDRGIHICKSMLAYQKFGNGQPPTKKSDHYVGDFYVKFAQEASMNPELEEEARDMLRKWEASDPETIKLWKTMRAWALEGFKETYEKYGVKLDKEYFESDVYQQGKEIILNNKHLFEEENGAVKANLDSYNLPAKILLRGDGTSIYITQDIALTLQKEKDFSPDEQIWVVGNEQNLHFQQLFAIMDLLGVKKEFHHLSYGMVYLPEGKMKSREGTVIDADDLLQDMEHAAAAEIRKRQSWDEAKVQDVAHHVAIGAIKFFMLKYDPAKDFTFDKEQSLSFEGDTGPYLQYTHARICSILEKTDGKNGDPSLLVEDEEQALLKELDDLREAYVNACTHLKPSTLANQLIKMGHACNTFYHKHHVLKAPVGIQHARIWLLQQARQALKEGLVLLGIHAMEHM